jgi:hypothetical protein
MRPALLLLAALLPAAEIHLVDGRVLDGEISDGPTPGTRRITTMTGSMAGEITVKATDIARVIPGETAAQRELRAVRSKRDRLGDGGDAAALWALAQRARGAGDGVLAKELAALTLRRDRGHLDARRLLGHRLMNGVWMLPHEAAVAEGRVWHEGGWVTWDERERLLADAERRRAEAEAAREELRQRLVAQQAVEQPVLNVGSYTYGSYRYGPGCWVSSGAWSPWYTGAVVNSYYRPTLSVVAAGGSSNFRWGFRWNW